MSIFNRFRRNDAIGDETNENYEFYEDTHNERGDYTGRLREFQRAGELNAQPRFTNPNAPRAYQNFMVYEPKTADDVQTLIDFLKKRESAIINLDNVEEEVSQRVLDFVSGAIYALNGSVHRISGNIFLLSPEGVGITNPYENEKNER